MGKWTQDTWYSQYIDPCLVENRYTRLTARTRGHGYFYPAPISPLFPRVTCSIRPSSGEYRANVDRRWPGIDQMMGKCCGFGVNNWAITQVSQKGSASTFFKAVK